MKNYGVVVRHRVRIFMAVVMFFTTMLGFSQDSTPVLDAQSNPPQLGACGDAATFTVTLNLGTTAYPNAQLEITIPNDFEYVNGEQTNVGAVNFVSQTGNKVTLNLNIPAHTATQPQMHVTFKAKALCGSIATTAVGATKPRMRYKLTGAGAEQLKEGKDINVLYAALKTSVTPPTSTMASGEQVVRNITITNGGNGAIKSFKLTTTMGAGLQIVNSDTSLATGWTVNHNGAGEYEFSGSTLDPGQSVTIKQTVSLQGCSDFTSSYTASYGCGGALSCDYPKKEEATANPTANFDPTKKPNLEVTNVKADGTFDAIVTPGELCLNTDITHHIRIHNKGGALAKNPIITLETSRGERFGSTHLLDGQYEMSFDPNFITVQIPTVKHSTPINSTYGARFGTAGKTELVELNLSDIPAGQSLYLRFKSRNNAPVGDCTNRPDTEIAFGYIVDKVKYSDSSVCNPDPDRYTSNHVISEGMQIEASGSNVMGALTVSNGEIYDGIFTLHRLLASPAGLKAGDYFDVVLELSPSLTVEDENTLKIKNSEGNPYTVTPIQDGNKWRFRFKFNEIFIGTAKWTSTFQAFSALLEFKARYQCGSGTSGAPAWYKVNMELKREISCSTSDIMSTRCTQVDLQPLGCTSGCTDGLVRQTPKIQRLTYGNKPTNPDNAGKPLYPLTPIDDFSNIATSSYHAGDRIRFEQSGVVQKTIATEVWTEGQFSVEIPDIYALGTAPKSIIHNETLKLVLERGGNTYTATGLSYTGGDNAATATITVHFDMNTLHTKGFPNTITDFQNSDKLTISFEMTPNNYGVTNSGGKVIVKGQKIFRPNFKLTYGGNDRVCGPSGLANSYYALTRFAIYIGGNSVESYRRITECQTTGNVYFYYDALVNEQRISNTLFPNEHRTFLTPKKAVFNVPKGLLLTEIYFTLEGQGTSSFGGVNGRYVLPTPITNNPNFEFDLKEYLSNKLGTPTLNLDEGYRFFINPVLKPTCHAGDSEELKMSLFLEGTGQSVHSPRLVYNNNDNIPVPTQTITYLIDNNKITSFVAQPIHTGNTDEVSWVVQVANSSIFHKFTNLWIGATDMNITSVQEVTDATGNSLIGAPLTKETSGIFKLGELATTKTRFFLVKSNISDCGQGDRTILFGQGCEGYPNAIDADSPCVKKLPVKYAKTEAAFQVKIISQPPADYRPNLCDQIEYDIEINNSGAGLAKDIHLDIPLGTDQGLFFVSGSAYISQKYTTGTQSTTGSWANANVTSANDIISIGLATNTLSIGEKIRVRFKVQTTSDCRFTSHQKLQFIPKGRNFCGSDIIDINSATSDNIIIQGDNSNRPIVVIEKATATVTFAEIGATGSPMAKYEVKFVNKGSDINSDAINANAKFAVKLPTGWTFVDQQEIETKSGGKLQYESLEDGFYVYKLLTSMPKGQALEINDISMKFTGAMNCDNTGEVQTQLYYVVDAGTFGSNCSVAPTCNLKTVIVDRKQLLVNKVPKAKLKTDANTDLCGTKTIADLNTLVTGNANLVWYATQTGGVPLATNVQIPTGTTSYYLALKDALTDCESAERLVVTVTVKEISERGHISISRRQFCDISSLTVQKLKETINLDEEGLIKVYDNGGSTAKLDTDILTPGVLYQYTRTQAGKCESDRRDITLIIGKTPTPVLSEVLCGQMTVDQLKAKFPTPSTIKVYNGASEVTSGNLGVGNYQITNTENGKCESDKLNIIIYESPVLNITKTDASCGVAPSVKINGYNTAFTYTITPNLTIATDGTITGYTYGTSYEVKVTNGGCSAIQNFVVSNTCTIDAVDDLLIEVDALSPLRTSTTTILSNDTLGTASATSTNVTITQIATTDPRVTIDTATGKVQVNSDSVPTGIYTITYRICEKVNGTPCDTATVTVKVINIKTGDDEFTYENGSLSGSGNILDNDKYNGTIPSIPAEVTLTTLPPAGITVSPTGDILVSNAKSGIYTFTYQLCSKVFTDVCDSATVTITVKNRIEANDDDNGDSVNGYNLVPNSTIDIFANDRLDGKGVSSQTVTITTHTSLPVGVTIDVNGKVTIGSDTPTGLHSFTYTLCEKGVTPANCDTAKVIFTVKNIDAVDDDFGVQTVGTTTKTVFENDKLNGVSPTSATVSVTPNNLPIGVTLNSDGTLTIGNTASSGTHTFTYTICDKANTGICDTATATVTIKKVVATDDSYSITDTTVTQTVGNVLDNDKVGTQTATTTLVTIGNIQNPTGSNVPALDTNGNITIPQGTLPNIYTITYEICLSGGSTDCDTAEVQVVVGTPTLTVANDTYTATTIATPRVVGNVLSNDAINGHTPVLPSFVNIGVKQPATPIGAGVTPTLSTITGDVEVPANTPAGVYTIVYELCPKGIVTGSASCKTATVTVTVSAPEIVALPNAYTVTTTTTTQTVGNVLDNDSLGGVSVSTSTVTLTPGAFTHPNITMGTDGNITISPNTPSGTYTGTYTICDRVNTSNCTSTTVTVTITAVATPTVLVANDDPVTVTTTQSGTVINVLDNDRIGTNTPTTSDVTITVTSTPTGTNVPILDPLTGNVTVPSGTPTATYEIGYKICTKVGIVTCSTATVTITVTEVVTPTNTTVAKDDFRTTYVNTQVSGSVAANDLDPEGDTQVWTTQTNTTGGHTFVLNADGTYTFTPSTDFVGTVSYTYEVCDNGTPQACATATVYISVKQVATPTATSDTFTATTSTNTQTVGNVLNNDRIGTNTPTTSDVTIMVTKTPTGTIVPILDPSTGNVTVPSGTPTGTYTIGYEICTKVGTVTCSTATVTITVTEVVTPTVLIATDDPVTVTTTQSGTVVNVLDNDKIGTNTPTTSDVTITVTKTPTGTIVPILDPSTGNVTVPSGTPTGTYTIGYKICTKVGTVTCSTATVTITVTEVVTPTNTTVAKDDINNTYVNTQVSGSVGTNDLDPEGDTQVWTIQTNTVGGHSFVLNADGTYTFTPSTDFVGTVSYTYEVCDNGTPQACATATISIQVLPKGINSLVANDDTAVTKVNTGVLISVLSNDFDPEGDTFSVTKHTNPSHGTVVLNADGTFTYTPTTDFVGEDEFTYIICDGNVTSTCRTARVHVSVVSTTTNITVANDDAYNTDVNVAVVGNVLNNDTDPEGDTVTTTVVTTPSNGTLSLSTDGTFTYTPTTNFVGTDSFTYRVCDSGTPQACDEATVYITVKGVVATPTANTDTFTATTSTNTQTVGNVLDNDRLGTNTPTTSDVTITVTSTPTGTIVPNLDPVTGNVTVPSGTPTGTYVIGYEICTKSVTITCDTATVTIVVTEVTTPTTPVVAKDDVEQTVVDTPVTVKVVSNDEHVPTQGTLTIVTQPKNGTVVINDNGTTNAPSDDEVVYTPNRGYAGVDSFEYELCDTMGNCSIAKVTITVLDEVIPYNAISVNGDGLNDYFHIQGIERYPNNTVRIYNRWGVKVFETKGYDNVNRVFRAISNGRVTIEAPEKLPQGTYYYIIEYTDNNNKKHTKGSWLYIKK
ncbi:Ig-like domain-containing protein [Capnocytophaga sp. H2931]|nr:Ig-like domain-containing protein [Capnocytophaga sp. H2931]